MFAFVLTMAVSVVLGVAVIGFVAYPHRGRRVPGPEPVSDALAKVGSRLADVLDPEEEQPPGRDGLVGASHATGTAPGTASPGGRAS
ncbi:hypothetical protein [Motilibacter deserti]|uniref:Uncharacterized protein n=1 Tax=Motilibacter deserti TaxID=2714956 RepID=A0ABX0GRP9_9ACTN|nr:hypothetical protein [Motilibacter deserti]NHC13534.1 hypothetical protein [Motilibacter deserti]